MRIFAPRLSRPVVTAFVFGIVTLMQMSSAHPAGSSMPWEQPLQQILVNREEGKKEELEAAKAMERPNTIWISRRNPPLVSPKASESPVMMITITAMILATGPWMESRIC